MLAVIASMEQELAGLRQELRTRRHSGAGLDEGSSNLALQVVGVGKQSQANVRSLLARRLASSSNSAGQSLRLLLLGFAGAVDPALQTGDLLLSSRYYRVAEDNGECPTKQSDSPLDSVKRDQGDFLTPDPVMWRLAIDAAGQLDRPVAHVESLTVDELVTTPQAKEAIRRSYEVGVVDMEDYWVASVARDAGVPFLAARVVLDRAEEALPSYLPELAGSRARAIALTAMKPWRIPLLVGLARRLPEAQVTLARFSRSFEAALASNQVAHSRAAAAGSTALAGPSLSAPG